jgi:hypothetical protein
MDFKSSFLVHPSVLLPINHSNYYWLLVWATLSISCKASIHCWIIYPCLYLNMTHTNYRSQSCVCSSELTVIFKPCYVLLFILQPCHCTTTTIALCIDAKYHRWNKVLETIISNSPPLSIKTNLRTPSFHIIYFLEN